MRACDETERRGVQLVMPLLMRSADPGAPVIDTNHAHNAELWQRGIGDFILKHKATGRWVGVEVKTEGRYTGNLFVEAWSNKSHVRTREGWINTLGADWLFMVYLDVRACFVVPVVPLKDWCVTEGNMFLYDEKIVQRFTDGDQRNRTTGHPVPWRAFPRDFGIRVFRLLDGAWAPCEIRDITLAVAQGPL